MTDDMYATVSDGNNVENEKGECHSMTVAMTSPPLLSLQEHSRGKLIQCGCSTSRHTVDNRTQISQ